MKQIVRAAAAVALVALAFAAQAQQMQYAGTVNYKYSDRIDESTNISPLGDELFGDSTSDENGATSFSITDINAKTNVRLPVQLGRTLRVPGSSTGWTVKVNPLPNIFGNEWDADVPYIQNDSTDSGWGVNNNTGAVSRCANGDFSVTAQNVSVIVVPAHNFYFGNMINIPGYGSEKLLSLRSDGKAPTAGGPYVGTTKSNWKISCLPSIKNGIGEGYVVTLPDGAKYYFDWLASAPTGYISTERGALNMQQNRMYATYAIDRFGGRVDYTYDPAFPHHITKIAASDGATITISYNPANGKIASATLGTRTWQYAYTAQQANRDYDYLTTVTLPDSSKWSYSAPPGPVDGSTGTQPCTYVVGSYTTSQPPTYSQTFHMVHPSGAVGDFSFRPIMFGYNRVSNGGCGVNQDYTPKAYIGNALYAKTISGPGIPTKTWNLSFYPSWSYYGECTSCPTTASTVITETGGKTTTYVFGNDYSTNAGQLLSKTVSGGGVTSTEQYTYLTSATGQPFPDLMGDERVFLVGNGFFLYNRPLQTKTVTQDGVVFTNTIQTFDAFVRPTKIRRASAPQP